MHGADCSTTGRMPVLVFDLDGTILRINSFPRWVLFLLAGRSPGLGPGRRAVISASALLPLFQRKLGRMDHDAMLRQMQRVWKTAAGWQVSGHGVGRLNGEANEPPLPLSGFTASLRRHVRDNLRSLLGMVAAEQLDAVLATAAAGDYALEFGRQLGFRHVLATGSDRAPDERTNSGQRKRDRVFEFFDAAGWRGRPMVLFTDHIDDLPLMRESKLVCWFGPEKLMEAARAATGEVHFVFCQEVTGDVMLVHLDGVRASCAV
jgi:phosphoserine phosphatase